MPADPPLHLGIDVTGIQEWRDRLIRTPATAQVAFTTTERELAAGDPRRLAATWACKEAVAKALGTGFDGIGWHGIEVLRQPGAREAVARIMVPPPNFPPLLGAGVLELGDRIVATVVGHAPGHQRCQTGVSAGLVEVATTTHRSGRHRGYSLAARHAALIALASLLERSRQAKADGAEEAGMSARGDHDALHAITAAGARWSRTDSGAPVLHVGNGTRIPVSLAHGAGLAAAVTALCHH